jgi:hypothetical protein
MFRAASLVLNELEFHFLNRGDGNDPEYDPWVAYRLKPSGLDENVISLALLPPRIDPVPD